MSFLNYLKTGSAEPAAAKGSLAPLLENASIEVTPKTLAKLASLGHRLIVSQCDANSSEMDGC